MVNQREDTLTEFPDDDLVVGVVDMRALAAETLRIPNPPRSYRPIMWGTSRCIENYHIPIWNMNHPEYQSLTEKMYSFSLIDNIWRRQRTSEELWHFGMYPSFSAPLVDVIDVVGVGIEARFLGRQLITRWGGDATKSSPVTAKRLIILTSSEAGAAEVGFAVREQFTSSRL